jgi:putative transposon-encoded protein
MKQIKIFEKIAKSAGVDGSAGRIYVPKEWIGKKVIVYLKEAVKKETHGGEQ